MMKSVIRWVFQSVEGFLSIGLRFIALQIFGYPSARDTTTTVMTFIVAKRTAPMAHHQKKLENADASNMPKPTPAANIAIAALPGFPRIKAAKLWRRRHKPA